MKIFYGILRGNLWAIGEECPASSYIVVQAATKQDAEVKLFAMVNEYNPRIYL